MIQRLKLQRGHEEPVQVITQAKLSTNNDQMMVSFARAGQGLILLPQFMVETELEDGRLREVLPEYRLFPERKLYAVFPHGRHLPLKTRALIDFSGRTCIKKPSRPTARVFGREDRGLVVVTIDVGKSNRNHIKDTSWRIGRSSHVRFLFKTQ